MFYIILITHLLIASILLFTLIQFFLPKKLITQAQAFFIVLPLAIYQLFSGFTMISLKHYHQNEFWIRGSVIGFFIFILSWLIFVKFSSGRFRPLSFIMLILSTLTVLSMVFLMTNKITG